MSDTDPGLHTGSDFGHYHLKRLLGRGEAGEVYEAVDTVTKQTVALKLLSPSLSHDPGFRRRLEQYADAGVLVREPHMMPVNDHGEIDGRLYLEMPLIHGTDLAALLQRDGPLPPARAVDIVSQVAAALDAAHAAGLIHRDVKARNILLADDDFVYLTDFGIGGAASDAETGPGVDVNALASVLHECLTGSPAGQPGSEVPEPFGAVIAKGMAEDADERYGSAGELAGVAHQALDDSPADRPHPVTPMFSATRDGWPDQSAAAPEAHNPGRGGKRLRWVAAALAGVLAVGAIWLIFRPHPQQQKAETAPAATPAADTSAPSLSPAETQGRLLKLLPAGYPPGACKPAAALAGAVAEMSCGPNTDPNGPPAASYTLFIEPGALQVSFDTTMQTLNVVTCPGRIQSPGPWHRAAAPDRPNGTLLCGVRQNNPMLVWTDDANLLVAAIRGDRNGVTLDQLYSWWSSHS